jgi:hypothetical protein
VKLGKAQAYAETQSAVMLVKKIQNKNVYETIVGA